jgi:hypothetical protein
MVPSTHNPQFRRVPLGFSSSSWTQPKGGAKRANAEILSLLEHLPAMVWYGFSVFPKGLCIDHFVPSVVVLRGGVTFKEEEPSGRPVLGSIPLER